MWEKNTTCSQTLGLLLNAFNGWGNNQAMGTLSVPMFCNIDIADDGLNGWILPPRQAQDLNWLPGTWL